MESLPDETLINIYYQLSPEEARNLCLANPNLARFCREKSVRLSTLKNFYAQRVDNDVTFVTLITSLIAESRDLERIEALLSLHPEWINAIFELVSPDSQQTLYARPLELASNHPNAHPELIAFLLSHQADPLEKALLDWNAHSEEESWLIRRLSTISPPDLGYSILKASSMYGNPLLHLICLYSGYVLTWNEIDFSEVHLDILMTYANRDPLPDATLFSSFIPARAYFPLLRLLQRMQDNTVVNRSFLGILSEVAIASYRPVKFQPKELKLDFSLLANASNIPFYQLRQLDFWLGPLTPSVWGEEGLERRLASLSQLIVTLPPEGHIGAVEHFTVRLNYYSGLGLVVGLRLLGLSYSVEKAEVMGMTQRSLEQDIPIDCLDADYAYRLSPSVAILPHLLTLEPKEGERFSIQYEDPDFANGVKLAAYLSGSDPEGIIRIVR